MWQASSNFETAKLRASIMAQIRAFFDALGVVEVDTPALCHNTGTDAYLDAFKTHYVSDSSGDRTELYLHTSPEFAMKRLISSGYGCIYQICKSFRDEPKGSHHNPEFTMLEWYRLGFDHHDLIAEVNDLLSLVLKTAPPIKISYQNVFLNSVGVDPLLTNKEELIAVIRKFNKFSEWHLQENNMDMLLQFIFSEIIENDIGKSEPWFIYDFPASQASLAKVSKEDQRVAHRFECYYKGLELANGFYELQDSTVQLSRFNQDNQQRLALGKEIVEIDKHFIAGLTHGLPECSGVALGVDRLIMLALDKNTIDEVITFPIQNA